MIKDKPLMWFAKCAKCGKAKNQHRSGTLECPKGKKTPTGYKEYTGEYYEDIKT
jgi:hypothetical protein